MSPTFREIRLQQYGCFVCPHTGHVTYSVSTSSKHQQRFVKGGDILYTFPVTFGRQIEASESVSREGICATLEDDCIRLVHVHDSLNNRLENVLITLIVYSIFQRKVCTVVLAGSESDILISGEWKFIFRWLTLMSPVPGKYSPNL